MRPADRDDQHNRACTDLLTGLHLARRAILVPAPVVAEVSYLLGRAGGAKVDVAVDVHGHLDGAVADDLHHHAEVDAACSGGGV